MLGIGISLFKAVKKFFGGGSAPFDLTQIGDLLVWYKNGVGVAANRWDDSSGNGNYMEQTNGSNQATVTNGGLDFEGSDYYTIRYDQGSGYNYSHLGGANDSYAVTHGTFFMVVEPDTNFVKAVLSSSINSQFFIQINRSTTVEYRYRGGSNAAGANFDIDMVTDDFITNGKSIAWFRKAPNGAPGQDYLTPGLNTTYGGVLNTWSTNMNNNPGGVNMRWVWDRVGAQGTSLGFDGAIYEFAYYEKALTDDEVNTVLADMALRNGITL